MDKVRMKFETVVVTWIASLGCLGVIGGLIIILCTPEIVAGTACISLGTTALGGLGGVLVSPQIRKESTNEKPVSGNTDPALLD